MENFVNKVSSMNKAYGNYKSPDFTDSLDKIEWQLKEAIGECFEGIEAVEHYREGRITKDDLKEKLIDAFTDNQVFMLFIPELLGLNADDHMNETLEANMTKICTSVEEAIETKNFYKKLGVSCHYEQQEDVFVVRSSLDQTDKNGKHYSSNKVLKNVNWKEPDHKQYFK